MIFGLTVSECALYSQTNTSDYYQVSYVNTQQESSHNHSKLYVYGKNLLSKKIVITLITYLDLQEIYSVKNTAIFKLQNEQYQKISSILTQSIFLNKKFTSCNQYTRLYIV